ncbi:MAG: hypothetical protein K2W96_10265, partial [Gemmataceae bacterium]|nr:hypothetical protein [Gemmataceae bacterium]
ALLGAALVAGVVIKISHKDGKQTKVTVPPGSEVEIDGDGEVRVKLPDGGKGKGEAKLRRWPPAGSKALGKRGEEAYSLAYSGDGKRLLAGGFDGKARLWELSTGKKLLVVGERPGHAVKAGLSPDGWTAVVAGQHMRVRIWDGKKKEMLADFGRDASEEVVFGTPRFLPDGKRFLLIHRDGHAKGATVALYETRPRGKVASTTTDRGRLASFPHEKYVSDVAVSPDGKRLATVAEDALLRLWDLETGKLLDTKATPGGNASCVVWPAGGARLVLAVSKRVGVPREGNTIQGWDAKGDTLREDSVLAKLEAAPSALALSDDGKRMAFADLSGRLVVTGPGGEIGETFDEPVVALAFSPDGKTLAVGYQKAPIWLVPLAGKP